MPVHRDHNGQGQIEPDLGLFVVKENASDSLFGQMSHLKGYTLVVRIGLMLPVHDDCLSAHDDHGCCSCVRHRSGQTRADRL